MVQPDVSVGIPGFLTRVVQVLELPISLYAVHQIKQTNVYSNTVQMNKTLYHKWQVFQRAFGNTNIYIQHHKYGIWGVRYFWIKHVGG